MTSNTHGLRQTTVTACCVVFLLALAAGASACDFETRIEKATVEEVTAFFSRQSKTVVTFVGYSGAGYEDDTGMLETAAAVLKEFEPSRTIVNIGGTPEGIGAVYELASRRGFLTTGIVSTQASEHNVEMADCVEYVFYVEDATWGGFLEGSDRLSPTSTAMVESSDVLVGIGGGAVSRDELTAARRSGKDVRFYPADMDHEKAKQRARQRGLPAPTDFGGAAGEVFGFF